MISFSDFMFKTQAESFLKEEDIAPEDSASVDKAAAIRMRVIVTIILTKFKFFSGLIAHLPLVKTNSVDTMATDGQKIYYNPSFTMSLTEEEALFVVCHEIMHNVLKHFDRNRPDPKLWNMACDYALNPLIQNMGKMPKLALYKKAFLKMSAEKIYDLISQEMKKNPQPPPPMPPPSGSGSKGDSGSGENSGEGSLEDALKEAVNTYNSDPKKWNLGNVSEPGEIPGADGSGETTAVSADLAKVWEKRIKDVARKVGRGSIKGPLGDYVNELISPQVNWKSELRNFVNTISNKVKYEIPYKRFASMGTYLPGPVKEKSISNPVIVIDTSGSISDEDMKTFSSEIKSLANSYNMQDIHIMYADDRVQHVKVFRNGSQLGIQKTPGGGTNFIPAFDWVENNLVKKGKKPAFFIYLTDGVGPMPTVSSLKDRTLWVIVNDKSNSIKVPFGKKINIISEPNK